MATLTVWKFKDPDAAEKTVETLKSLQSQALITIVDAAVVEWHEGKKRPKTHQLKHLVGAGALGGAFWGVLFGLLFFIPLIGLAVGVAAGAIAGSLTDVGIDDDFIKEVKKSVTPGTSALFLMTQDEVPDKVAGAFKDQGGELITTNLSTEQEKALRAAFSDE